MTIACLKCGWDMKRSRLRVADGEWAARCNKCKQMHYVLIGDERETHRTGEYVPV